MRNGILSALLALLLLGAATATAHAADPDTDGDGVADIYDACTTLAGPASNHGCPPPGDYDWDGIPDADDLCPFTAATTCEPPSDVDADGVPDRFDACPSTPGLKTRMGCPPPGDDDMDGIPNGDDPCPFTAATTCDPPSDVDADGVPDRFDACPSAPGPKARGGCPGPYFGEVTPTPGELPVGDVPIAPAVISVTPDAEPSTAETPAPETLPAASAVPLPVTFAIDVAKAGKLTLKQLPAGATVTVSCKAKACSKALRKAVTKRSTGATLNLSRLVKRVPAGTSITLVVAKPGSATVTKTVKLR